MSLDYRGLPDFIRERELATTNVSRARINSFIDKAKPQSQEDIVFDDLAKIYLKGEALKNAIGEMGLQTFIPVEDGASVKASIQRIYSSRTDIITFGQFKEACEFIASRNSSIDEDFLLKFKVIDPKLENTSITTKYKGIKNNGNDWISSFLEQLSSFAGMLIAGKMADLSFLISPQLDIDSEGGSGSFKSWGAQGSAIAICLLIELGVSLFEFKRLYGDSVAIPDSIKSDFESLYNDPSKRESILTDAGFDYKLFKENQRFNDYKAIKDYCIDFISKNQDDLSYDHWISYSQVVDLHLMVTQTMPLAPSFSDKWRRAYSDGPDSYSSTATSVVENVDTQSLGDFVVYNMNSAMMQYLRDISANANATYDLTYKSLGFEVDPALICCLVWYLGPMDLESLKKISSILRIASLNTHSNAKDLLSYFGESVLTSLMHMMCHYASQVLDSTIKQFYKKMSNVPDETLNTANRNCIGFKVILSISRISLKFIVNYIEELVKQLSGIIHSITSKTQAHSANIQKKRTFKTLSLLLDHIIANIEHIQPLCPTIDKMNSVIDNDSIADNTFNLVATIIPNAFPVLKMSEIDRRKHFANLPPEQIKDLDLETPGTDSNGIANVYSNIKPSECGEDFGAQKNIILGNQIAAFLRNN